MELRPRRFADTVVLAPAGRIDHASAEGLRTALEPHLAACAQGRDRLVLDLADVEYIASVGLRVLMLACKQVKAQGGSLLVAGMQPVVREIIEISKFTFLFRTYGTVRDALAAVSPAALAAFDAT
jgi:anti-anti-sigma factor